MFDTSVVRALVTSSAPCEAHPPCCRSCAWDPEPVGSARVPGRRLSVVRTAEAYGCVRRDASIVVDEADGRPYMQVDDGLHPLSLIHGGIIAGSKLEADIHAA